MPAAAPQLASLLAPHEPPPYTVENPTGTAPFVFTCDHASHAVPEALDGLGLSPADLRRHIGWDIGAAALTRKLSRRFNAPAVLSGYSRLVIDCNRKPRHATSIPPVSDGTVIPGNLDLAPEEAARRAEALFRPYHQAIETVLDRIRASVPAPAFLAIHTFTPRMNGRARPWHVGVLWDEDPRIPEPLIRALRRHAELTVGDNQPYSGRDHFDFSNAFHATAAGLPNALVEVREDLLRTEAGVERWADILGNALRDILDDSTLYREVR